jgi:hypothetical protein
MNNLLENILNEDYVSANKLFEERLGEILEQKLYEQKRMMQAEAFGGLSLKDIEDRKKAGYRKASDVLRDPRGGGEQSEFKKKLERIQHTPKTKKKSKKVAEATDAELADLAKRTKVLKAAPRDVRIQPGSDRDPIAYGKAETRARELKSRGSVHAAKWLKGTKIQRNVAGATRVVKNFGADVIKGLAGLGEDTE